MSTTNPEPTSSNDEQQEVEIKSSIPLPSTSSTPSTPLQQSISQIKSQLAQINQQLVTLLLSTSSPNINNQQHSLQLLELAQQLQLNCDNLSTTQLNIRQQQIHSQQLISQQQKAINQQQLESKQSQVDFERKMLEKELLHEQKCRDFEQQIKSKEFDVERREFELELIKNEYELKTPTSTLSTNQYYWENYLTPQNQKSINHIDTVQISPSTTSTTSITIDDATEHNIFNESIIDAFHNLHQDYQAIKYLAAKNQSSHDQLNILTGQSQLSNQHLLQLQSDSSRTQTRFIVMYVLLGITILMFAFKLDSLK